MAIEVQQDADAGHRASLLEPALVGAVGVGALALLHVRDPHSAGSYGFCPFLNLTGLPCPGCGGLRAVNDLTYGDVAAALTSNALAVVLVAVAGVAWLVWLVRRWRGSTGRMLVLNARTGYVVLAVAAAFAVFRWTPWGSWLYT